MLGNNQYSIQYLDSVVMCDIPALPVTVKKLVKKAIEQRLTVDPLGLGKPLRYSLKRHFRIRVGNYRIVYRVEQRGNVVLVVAIKHRKHIYEH